MQEDRREHDLEARLSFLRTSEGGRRHAALGDGRYRPSHDFARRGFLNDGVHVFVGKVSAAPGESVLAQIWLVSPESLRGHLHLGQGFTVNEGSKVVANAVVTRIVNPSLERAHLSELMCHLRDLEVTLHRDEVRQEPGRLDELLHESFREIGRTGRQYSRAEAVESMRAEASPGEVWSQDFCLAPLADGLALLTYRSARVREDGSLFRHALRSSIWQQVAGGWQVRFHQVTPVGAFERDG